MISAFSGVTAPILGNKNTFVGSICISSGAPLYGHNLSAPGMETKTEANTCHNQLYGAVSADCIKKEGDNPKLEKVVLVAESVSNESGDSRSAVSTIVLEDEATGMKRSPQSTISTHPKYMQEIPKLGTIMKMLPKESFRVSTKESLLYFGLDLAAVVACLSSLHMVITSDLYHSLAMWQQAIMVGPLQVLSGFAMWCMWCIGHDAGHTTVSKKYPWVNRLVGEVTHSVICLTPFIPWAKSHLKHHLNHNHIDRDYSHQWFVREEKDELNPIFLAAYELRNLQLPFLYLVYLLIGIPDGGHVIFYGRM